MIKREELTNPSSCMSRAKDEEMTFVLLERDDAAPSTIRYWISRRISLGKNNPSDPQIIDAEQCAREMEMRKLNQRRLFLAEKKSTLGFLVGDQSDEFDRLQSEYFDYISEKFPRNPVKIQELLELEKTLEKKT